MSINSDSSFINKKMLKSKKSMQAKTHSKLDTTCSQLWQNSKPKEWTDLKCHHLSKNKSQLILTIQTSPIQLTGEPKELLTQLKTKNNADHAGLSQPPLPLKENTSLRLEHSFLSLNNNSLIALQPVKDVTEVGNQVHSHMQDSMLKISRLITLTLPQLNLAKPANTLDKLKLLDTPLSHPNLHLNLWLQLQNNQFQSLLKLTPLFSNNIPQVSWTLLLAEPNLTTLLLPLVMELTQLQDKTTTLLETHGELHGETKDTSRSLLLKEQSESVESNKHLFTHPQTEKSIN